MQKTKRALHRKDKGEMDKSLGLQASELLNAHFPSKSTPPKGDGNDTRTTGDW